MRVIELSPEQIERDSLCLGFAGERNHTRILFRCGAIFAEYPEASVSLTVRSPHGTVYRTELSREEDSLSWTVSAADTAYAGAGRYQLTFIQGEEILKTFVGSFLVLESINATGRPPDPLEDWLERADETLEALAGLTASADTLPPGSPATAELVDDGGCRQLRLGIPEGKKGAAGIFSFDVNPDGHLIYTFADVENLDFELSEGRLIALWQEP